MKLQMIARNLGEKANQKRMHDFNYLLNECNLIDLVFSGPRFTWSNCKKDNLILGLLDRFLANPNWITNFPNFVVTHLPRTTSDHCPIMINLNPGLLQFRKSYKLKTMWPNHPTFDLIVDQNWSSQSIDYSSSINRTTNAIINWNQNTYMISRMIINYKNFTYMISNFFECGDVIELRRKNWKS